MELGECGALIRRRRQQLLRKLSLVYVTTIAASWEFAGKQRTYLTADIRGGLFCMIKKSNSKSWKSLGMLFNCKPIGKLNHAICLLLQIQAPLHQTLKRTLNCLMILLTLKTLLRWTPTISPLLTPMKLTMTLLLRENPLAMETLSQSMVTLCRLPNSDYKIL